MSGIKNRFTSDSGKLMPGWWDAENLKYIKEQDNENISGHRDDTITGGEREDSDRENNNPTR